MINDTQFRAWTELFAPKDWLSTIRAQHPGLLTQRCCDAIAEEFDLELLRIAMPSITEKMLFFLTGDYESRGQFSEEQLKKAASETLTFLLENGVGALAEPFRLLEGKLTDHAHSFVRANSRLLELITVNRELIATRFFNGSPIGPLTGLKRVGKIYPGGVAVTELDFDGKKLIFKPRDCRIDAWFEALSQKYFRDCLYVPKTLALDDEAGFFEFIANRPAEGYKDAIAAIRNFGAFFAIADAFELFDLHSDNYFANGRLVAPIDLEGLLKVRSVCPDITDVLPFKFSPVHNALLSFRLKADAEEINPFTDKTQPCSILPRIDGEAVSVMEYPEEFAKGFEEMYLRLIKLKAELSDEVENTRGFFIRAFLPYGRSYPKAIELLNRPVALASERYQDFFLNWIRKKRGTAGEIYGEVCLYENDCVWKGYAPRFECRTEERHVYFGRELVAPGFLRETAIETVRSNLRELDEGFIPFAVRVIFWAFNKKIVHLPEDPEALSVSERKRTIAEIMESALICPDGRPIWLPEPVFDHSISDRDIYFNWQKAVLDFCRQYTGDCRDEEVIPRLSQLTV